MKVLLALFAYQDILIHPALLVILLTINQVARANLAQMFMLNAKHAILFQIVLFAL